MHIKTLQQTCYLHWKNVIHSKPYAAEHLSKLQKLTLIFSPNLLQFSSLILTKIPNLLNVLRFNIFQVLLHYTLNPALSIRLTVLMSQPFREQMPFVHDEICC